MRATGLAPEEEARQGRPLNGSESGGVAPGFLTRLPPQTGRETTCDPEPERAPKEPAAGTAPPCWGCWVALIWLDRDLSFQVLGGEKKKQGVRLTIRSPDHLVECFVTIMFSASTKKGSFNLRKQKSNLIDLLVCYYQHSFVLPLI